ncbi:MAG TPA: hypothetical protein VHE13_00720 [Opitutus sp.]|nr:hypothetical protein [Opitutus sp.]
MSESGQLPQFHVVGFSGHRRLAQPALVAAAIEQALRDLTAAAPGEWIALSSIAAGGDAHFAHAALRRRIPWLAVLPLPPAEFKRDFDDAGWREAEALLAEAEQVRVMTEAGSREDAYLDAGIETVNESDVLLAVWDGAAARGKGGTADVIAYARELGRPIIIIDAATGAARREHWDAFQPRDKDLAHFHHLPAAPATAWAAANPFGAPAPVVALQRNADHAASRGAPHFRRLIASTVLLHVLATLVAAAALAFGWHALVLPWIKLLCLLGALGVALVLRAQGAHHHWVRCRLAAEFCRSALATWGLPRAAPLFAELNLPGLRQLTRTLQVLHRRTVGLEPVAMFTFKDQYLRTRVDDQLAYYSRKLAQAEPVLARLRAGFWLATLLAIAATALYSIDHTWHAFAAGEHTEQLVYYFLPISLPVVAAALMSLVSINDLHRRLARYREMKAVLTAASKQIAYSQTWGSLERIVERTERALLQEVLEWHSIMSFTESH